MIVKDHSNCNEYNGNCGTSFGEVLCAHIHLCNIPFKILAKHFKITKEESSSSGIRRIKAVLE